MWEAGKTELRSSVRYVLNRNLRWYFLLINLPTSLCPAGSLAGFPQDQVKIPQYQFNTVDAQAIASGEALLTVDLYDHSPRTQNCVSKADGS